MSFEIEAVGIDMHVHARETGYETPEQFEELPETFQSITRAALRGGVVLVIDMPNNTPKTDSIDALDHKIDRALETMNTDMGFYFGTVLDNDNRDEYRSAVTRTFGLKIYAGETTGSPEASSPFQYKDRIQAWKQANSDALVLMHCEGKDQYEEYAELALELTVRAHFPHTSIREELDVVSRYKERHLHAANNFTVGTTPHHLYLSQDDIGDFGWRRRMKPRLGTPDDVAYMRRNVGQIDVFESDHAPHASHKKDEANELNPDGLEGKDHKTCYGVTGLEEMLPLMFEGIKDGWLTEKQLIQRIYTNPLRILRIAQNYYNRPRLTIETEKHVVDPAKSETKCAQTPYEGMTLNYRVSGVRVGTRTLMHKDNITSSNGSIRMPRLNR